jgi:L-ascorbate metabolism protein UlaG (beta-lactamase superfamily)
MGNGARPGAVEDSSALLPSDEVFLRPEAKLEPLVCGWYAWIHLFSPAQHAMNVAYRHIPLLQSFVNNPAVHLAAAADPQLFSGPFVQVPESRVRDVQQLLRDMESRCARLLTLARDLKQFDRQLQETAAGYSLNELYSQLPQSLQGLVELCYDINSHPKLRLYEELLYDENPGAGTQEIMLSLTHDEARTFFMSTPRLKTPDSMLFNMEFNDRRLDLLASMRTRPDRLARIMDVFDVPESDHSAFAQYFTRNAPPRREPKYDGDGVRVRYFGHACVLIETGTTSILMDPFLAWDLDPGDGRLTFCDLPDHLDYVVLSHSHQDHCSLEMLIQLRHRVGRILVPANHSGSITDPSMKLILAGLGYERIQVMSALERIELPEGAITSLPFPGEHVDLDIYSRHGIHLEIKGKRFMFLVDSDGRDAELFRRIARRTGRKLDAMFIGMECHGAPLTWLYGPLLTKPISRRNDESRRLSGVDSARGWRIIQEFDIGTLYVYGMGQEPWTRYIMGLEYTPDSIQVKEVAALLERCHSANMRAENLYLTGEMYY